MRRSSRNTLEREPGGAAQRACDLKRLALVSPAALDQDDRRVEAAAEQHGRARAEAGADGRVTRPEPDQPLDPDFEGVDRCGFVKGGADLRQRNCHGRRRSDPCRCGSAADALMIALLARRAHSGRLVGKWHRGLRFWVRPSCYGGTRDNKLVT
jgi:hypothetical protein